MSDESKTIRVFNLTDISTPTLVQHSAVGITFAVGRALVGPGMSEETADDVMTRAHLAHFVTIGAAAVDMLPPSYVVAKEKLGAAQKGAAAREAALAPKALAVPDSEESAVTVSEKKSKKEK